MPFRLNPENRSGKTKLLMVVLVVGMTFVVRFLVAPLWDHDLSFVLFYPAVVFCAWFGGFRGGALATMLLVVSLGPLLHADEDVTLPESILITCSLTLDGLAISYLIHQAFKAVRLEYEQRINYAQTFISQAPVAIAMFDNQMRYVAVSGRWMADYNLGARDIIGKSHYEIFPELPDVLREVHNRCLRGAIEQGDEELFVRRDGRRQWITWEVRPWFINEERGKIGGIFIFSEDVTELKLAHDNETALRAKSEVDEALRLQAEKINAAKDEFVANISHELRSPLNSVLGWSAVLKRSLHDPEKIERAVTAIELGARMQARLISDILDINRLASGKLRLHLERVSLDKLLHAAFDAALPQAKTRKVELLIEPLRGEELHLLGDLTRLQQCLANLISNALKFTEEGGSVVIGAEKVADDARITVTDTGQGISSEGLARIFERFFQSDTSSTRAHDGLGLGLSITKHLIDLHGGKVSAASAGLGKGSTFTIELPLSLCADSVPPLIACEGEISADSDLSGLNVLIVDDHLESREPLRCSLEDYGAVVHCAASVDGASRIALDRSIACDLIISDIAMPSKSGVELLSELRQAGITTPAIALSAFSGADWVNKALEAGFNQYLFKPVKFEELMSAISHACPGRAVVVRSGKESVGQMSREVLPRQ